MSDELMKKLDAALGKIASMESELAGFRKTNREPAFDIAKFRADLARDAPGTMKKLGIPIEYVTPQFVAEAMAQAGLQVPPQLEMQRHMGTQYEAQSQIASTVESLRQRLDASDEERKKADTRESLKKLAADKTKYPHLSKAYAGDPALFESRLTGGSAEDIAAKLEIEAAAFARAFGVKGDATPPASQDNADATTATSTQATAQAGDTRAGDPPPLPKPNTGSFTEDDNRKLLEEIDRKYKAGQYGTT